MFVPLAKGKTLTTIELILSLNYDVRTFSQVSVLSYPHHFDHYHPSPFSCWLPSTPIMLLATKVMNSYLRTLGCLSRQELDGYRLARLARTVSMTLSCPLAIQVAN